jgi:Fe-S cluster assembly iron-binding protein IscA
LGLVLDEPKENDDKYEFEGVTYLVDKDLGDLSGEIKVDFIDNGYAKGFSISSDKPVGGGGGCGSGCSC